MLIQAFAALWEPPGQTKKARGMNGFPLPGLCVQLLALGSVGLLLLTLVPVVFPLEFLNTAGGIHVLHFARKERVARRANLDINGLFGAARHELVAATACHRTFFVFGMNLFFHENHVLSGSQYCDNVF
jgi:uncharacterized metal-binding protein